MLIFHSASTTFFILSLLFKILYLPSVFLHLTYLLLGSFDESMDDVEESMDDEQNDWFEDEEPEEEKEVTFTILQKEGIIKSQKELINDVIAQVNLSAGDTALLLQHFKYVLHSFHSFLFHYHYLFLLSSICCFD